MGVTRRSTSADFPPPTPPASGRGVEINFDGLIGPTHNYAALSFGNLASATNAGAESRPREAALQGLAKMRFALSLGLAQGFLPPLDRPRVAFLRAMGFAGTDAQVCAAAFAADPRLFAQACSASSMWTANAATVSPAADTADGRTHLTIANLSRMTHRSIEHPETAALLRTAFAHPAFAVHDALPAAFGDEGAANHMRLTSAHDSAGVEIFVYGEDGGRFPARQNRRASEAVARAHRLDPARTLFVRQSPAAIDACRAAQACAHKSGLPRSPSPMRSGQCASITRASRSALAVSSRKRASTVAGSATTRSRRQAGPPPLRIDSRTST